MITLILASPPLDVSDWGGDRPRDNKRRQYGVPPVGNGLTHNKTTVGSFSS